MRKPTLKFAEIPREIARINALRDTLEMDALHALETTMPAVADFLLQSFSDRARAAHWMCTTRRAFGGRTAYELLDDGDIDTVWDEIASIGSDSSTRGRGESASLNTYGHV